MGNNPLDVTLNLPINLYSITCSFDPRPYCRRWLWAFNCWQRKKEGRLRQLALTVSLFLSLGIEGTVKTGAYFNSQSVPSIRDPRRAEVTSQAPLSASAAARPAVGRDRLLESARERLLHCVAPHPREDGRRCGKSRRHQPPCVRCRARRVHGPLTTSDARQSSL